MTEQKKTPSGDSREGVRKHPRHKPTRPSLSLQERLLRQAHWEIVQRVNLDPNPVKRPIAMLVAAAWKKSLMGWGAG